VVISQRPVGIYGDLGAEQVGGGALELEHVEQVPVVGDMAPDPTGGGEGQAGDAVPGSQADQLGGVGADPLLGGGRQVRRLGERLAHAVSLPGRGRPAASASRHSDSAVVDRSALKFPDACWQRIEYGIEYGRAWAGLPAEDHS